MMSEVRLTPELRDRLAERIAAFIAEPEPVTVERIDVARDVLGQLSERSDDWRVREAIGLVRHTLMEWSDEIDDAS